MRKILGTMVPRILRKLDALINFQCDQCAKHLCQYIRHQVRHGQFPDGSHNNTYGRINITSTNVFCEQYNESEGGTNRYRIARGQNNKNEKTCSKKFG